MIEIIPVISSIASIVFTAVVGYCFTKANKAQEQRDELSLKTRVLLVEMMDAQNDYLNVITNGCTQAFNRLEANTGLEHLTPFNGNVEAARKKCLEIKNELQHTIYEAGLRDVS